ncbi:DNA internalization-related competence protein ComEC/Rec2 [Undibacterium sp.]|jgi:competence protein ComEC|uniref:DNA internalization-related competence protein ComEC/Rec2 n=1 Tax=Undibacterium sp. TaxID=1914977 RepID=UPI002B54B9E3|nr:DNA internalization-related competence protein ComEC/Rec2 [Undibacterium sp.]HTD07221.1 DNA internalization-related competence protein ComEC/Rec2 [Undibacterium sp.]
MRSAIIGFVLGVVCLQQQASLLQWDYLGLLFAAAFLIFFIRFKSSYPHVRLALGFVGAGIAGFIWASVFAHAYLSQELPGEWEGRDITVIGTIDSLPHEFPQGVRFNFAVEQVLAEGGKLPLLPSKLSLSWYSSFGNQELGPIGDVRPGERWQLTVRLKRPHGNANSYAFDYEVWLLEQNLRATGAVRQDANRMYKNQRLGSFVWSFGNVVELSRAWLRQRINAALPDRPYAGVLVALVVGDQREVSQSDWKVFNRTGIGHLISISGLHITMIAGLFAGLVYWLWRRSFFTGAQLPLLLPAQKAAALAGALMAFVYVALAGFGVPAQRTLYMLMVIATALWCGRLTSVSHVLCLALGIVVVLDPWAVLWPGFWLSFGAVAIILFAGVGRVQYVQKESRYGKWRKAWNAASHTQYVVTLGLVPLTLLLFGQISLISPLANAVAIPLVSFVVTPLALAGSLAPAPLAGWLLQLAHACVALLASCLESLSALSYAVWNTPIPSTWMFVVAMLGTLWLLAPRGWPSRWLGLICWLPLLCNQPTHPKEGEMTVTAFDVGQGMALLVETAQHRLLYDTGPFYSPESDGGNRVILPYLDARGISRLDAVVVSHNDNDHSGGALSIFQHVKVGWVASSLAAGSAIVTAAPNHRRCEAGQAWEWDGIRFEMLQPAAPSYDSQKWKPNARSCMLKITQGLHSILLPGDIEAVQEQELLNGSADKLQATVLLAPHHGSGTSSTAPFLQAVRPELALFQVGYRNRFHHPKPEVFARYADFGIKRLRTDESGAITLQFGAGLEFSEYRSEHARYWYHR